MEKIKKAEIIKTLLIVVLKKGMVEKSGGEELRTKKPKRIFKRDFVVCVCVFALLKMTSGRRKMSFVKIERG